MNRPRRCRRGFAAAGWCALLLSSAVRAAAQNDDASRLSNRPVEPIRVIGNVYSVGASEVTSFLIATDAGDILIDGGFAETAPQVEANLKKIGRDIHRVKVLLSTQAHYDHAGGLAQLKRDSGAKFAIMAVDAPLVERGGRSDFGFGDRLTYEPLKPDRLLKDGDTVELGGSRLTAVLTPGHTRGCTTWTAKVDENGKRYDVVFFCSTSVPGYRLAGKPAYSGIVEDYRASFRRVASLSCDVFLAAHASFFDQEGKRERLAKDPRVNPFIDPDEMRRHVEESRKAFEAELSRQMREPSD